MPLSKKGSYHANPATARMHDGAEPATQPDPAGTATGGAQTVEIHSPDHPETGDGQNFHVRAHQADGSVAESKHPSIDEAADIAKAHLGGGAEENEAEPSDDAGESSGDNDDDEY